MKKAVIIICLSTFFCLMIMAQTIITKDKVNKVLTIKLIQTKQTPEDLSSGYSSLALFPL